MYKLLVSLGASALLLTGCSSSDSDDPYWIDEGGSDYVIPSEESLPGGGGYNYDPRTNQEKLSDFDDCISGGLGSNAVEIKETIDNCSANNLTSP